MLALTPLALSIGDKIDSSFFSFDTAVFSLFGKMQNGVLTYIAKFFTSFGDEMFVIPIVLLALILCLFKRTRKYGTAIVISVVIGTLVTNILVKPLVLRIRPYNTLQLTDFWTKFSVWYKTAGSLSESDYSFPSGHTTGAFEVAVAVFMCMKKNGRKLSWTPLVIALCVACSRIYLMVHYPTDVIAGIFVGACAGILGYLIAGLVIKIWEKVSFLDKIDLEKLFKKGINVKVACALIIVAVISTVTVSFVRVLNEGADYKETCAYVGEYDCMNEARVDDDDYPAIDGKYYCKIHWKQLNGENSD